MRNQKGWNGINKKFINFLTTIGMIFLQFVTMVNGDGNDGEGNDGDRNDGEGNDGDGNDGDDSTVPVWVIIIIVLLVVLIIAGIVIIVLRRRYVKMKRREREISKYAKYTNRKTTTMNEGSRERSHNEIKTVNDDKHKKGMESNKIGQEKTGGKKKEGSNEDQEPLLTPAERKEMERKETEGKEGQRSGLKASTTTKYKERYFILKEIR